MRHWSEVYSCRCGMRFRSYAAEARHRHNFPLLCRKAKRVQQNNEPETPEQKAAREVFENSNHWGG